MKCAARWHSYECALPEGHAGHHETEGGYTRWPATSASDKHLDQEIHAYCEELVSGVSNRADYLLCRIALGDTVEGAIGLIPQTVARGLLSEFFDKKPVKP